MLLVAVSRAQKRGDAVNRARALELLAGLECDAGNYADAVAHQTNLMRLTPEIGWEARLNEFAQNHQRYTRFRDGAQEVLRLDEEAQRCLHHNAEQALSLTQQALEHAREHLQPDHWLIARVLNTRGCIFYNRGETVEAREIWEQAEQILGEWPDRAPDILRTVRYNLRRCRRRLGF